MSYVGNTPADKFLTLEKQQFSVSATTGYTLSHSVSSPQDIALFINNVRQNPNSSYSVSNTALTLSSATSSGDTMYCVFLGKAIGTIAPASSSVTNDMLSGSIATSKLADGSTFGQTNTPAFHVELSGTQTIGDAVTTKVQFNTEVYDTNNNYDNSSNYRFTPQTAGKYFCYLTIEGGVGGVSRLSQFSIEIKKNGAKIAGSGSDFRSDAYGLGSFGTCTVGVSLNGSSDYLEAFCYINDQSAGNTEIYGGKASVFGAYKLIGA